MLKVKKSPARLLSYRKNIEEDFSSSSFSLLGAEPLYGTHHSLRFLIPLAGILLPLFFVTLSWGILSQERAASLNAPVSKKNLSSVAPSFSLNFSVLTNQTGGVIFGNFKRSLAMITSLGQTTLALTETSTSDNFYSYLNEHLNSLVHDSASNWVIFLHPLLTWAGSTGQNVYVAISGVRQEGTVALERVRSSFTSLQTKLSADGQSLGQNFRSDLFKLGNYFAQANWRTGQSLSHLFDQFNLFAGQTFMGANHFLFASEQTLLGAASWSKVVLFGTSLSWAEKIWGAGGQTLGRLSFFFKPPVPHLAFTWPNWHLPSFALPATKLPSLPSWRISFLPSKPKMITTSPASESIQPILPQSTLPLAPAPSPWIKILSVKDSATSFIPRLISAGSSSWRALTKGLMVTGGALAFYTQRGWANFNFALAQSFAHLSFNWPDFNLSFHWPQINLPRMPQFSFSLPHLSFSWPQIKWPAVYTDGLAAEIVRQGSAYYHTLAAQISLVSEGTGAGLAATWSRFALSASTFNTGAVSFLETLSFDLTSLGFVYNQGLHHLFTVTFTLLQATENSLLALRDRTLSQVAFSSQTILAMGADYKTRAVANWKNFLGAEQPQSLSNLPPDLQAQIKQEIQTEVQQTLQSALATMTPATSAGSVGASSAGQGLVVLPSQGTTSDSALRAKIQTLFSDQVQVNFDSSGKTGIITPVFRDKSGGNYIFMMTPLK